MEMKSRFNETRQKWLDHYARHLDETSLSVSNPEFKEAVLYSLNAGGKRLRPVILLEMSEHLGIDFAVAMKMATAIECLHTYTLVHDDLPAMDNDDFRRGLLTSHKKFGEDVAILVGDALQSLSFELLSKANIPSLAIEYFSKIVGGSGLILGQYLDMKGNQNKNPEYMEKMHRMKTGMLITSCLVLPYIYKNPTLDYSEIEHWGLELGHLFQIVDDILDVTSTEEELGKTPGKDASQDKLTYVQFYGLEKSRQMAKKISEELESHQLFGNIPFFKSLPKFIIERTS